MPTPRELLERLDSRHDELIRKLDELNAEIETALAQFGKAKAVPTEPADATADFKPIGKPAAKTGSRRAA